MEQGTHSFEVGQSVFLRSAQGDTKQEHLAKVVQVSDSEIGLEFSESRRSSPRTGSQFQTQTGDSLKLRCWDEEAVYYFEVDVIEVGKDGIIQVSRPEAGVTLQRRRTLRTDLEVPFSFTVLAAAQGQLVTDEFHEAKTENISLSGLRFESELPLSEGDEILVTLPMISIGEITASGRVIWTQRKSGTHLLSIGVRLRQLMPEEQDQILQFMKSVES